MHGQRKATEVGAQAQSTNPLGGWAGTTGELQLERSPPERPRLVSCSCLQRRYSGAFATGGRLLVRVCKAEVPRDRRSKTASARSKRTVKSARREKRQPIRNRHCHGFTKTHRTRKPGTSAKSSEALVQRYGECENDNRRRATRR